MRLKQSGEVLPLGFTVTQDSYLATMATSIRLPPRGQALVMSRVIGEVADKATVLLEGTVDLPRFAWHGRSVRSRTVKLLWKSVTRRRTSFGSEKGPS